MKHPQSSSGQETWTVFSGEKYVGRFYRKAGNSNYMIFGRFGFRYMELAIEYLLKESVVRTKKGA